MAELLETSSYFGLTLTLAIFWISHIGCRKLKISILNPILISSAIIIIILLCLDISYDTYEAGADLISKLLTPATICYAVPLYRQIEILKKRFVTIMISVACGSIASVLCVFGFSKLFHYSPEIFRLAQGHEAIRWILSFDIWRKRLPHEVWPFADSLKYNQQLSYQVKGGKVIPASEDQSNIKVRAFRSTDEGVAFLIEADGKVLYHGGDLNHWYWEGEDQNWNRSMEEKYTRQIERLAETLAERSVDAAFLPLDPRQEDAFYLGFHEFMEKIKVRFAFPMHC